MVIMLVRIKHSDCCNENSVTDVVPLNIMEYVYNTCLLKLYVIPKRKSNKTVTFAYILPDFVMNTWFILIYRFLTESGVILSLSLLTRILQYKEMDFD